ncbi:hypothetical protein EV127DRAFT_403441 [Xylaria flabelliformis]|nr:hypothetical protein EV127DRAFT_403441 [Xylaria flabelliformis]
MASRGRRVGKQIASDLRSEREEVSRREGGAQGLPRRSKPWRKSGVAPRLQSSGHNIYGETRDKQQYRRDKLEISLYQHASRRLSQSRERTGKGASYERERLTVGWQGTHISVPPGYLETGVSTVWRGRDYRCKLSGMWFQSIRFNLHVLFRHWNIIEKGELDLGVPEYRNVSALYRVERSRFLYVTIDIMCERATVLVPSYLYNLPFTCLSSPYFR